MEKKVMLKSIFAFALSFNLLAYAGPIVGNGGDGIALEFNEITGKIPKLLVQWPQRPTEIKLQEINAVIDQLSVDTASELFLDGIPKDAINYPNEKRITVHRGRWKDLNLKSKYALVLHELLGLSRINDANYNLSKFFLSYLNSLDNAWAVVPAGWVDVCDRSPAIKTYLLARFEKPCEDISPVDLSTIKVVEIINNQFNPTRPFAFQINDLSGFERLERFIIDKAGLTTIPSQFFIFNSHLQEISINAEGFNLGPDLFSSSIIYQKIVFRSGYGFTDNFPKFKISCSPTTFMGLQTASLDVIGSACLVTGSVSILKLNVRSIEAIPLQFWETLPQGISELSLVLYNYNLPPQIIPTKSLVNLHSIESLKIGYALLKSMPFENFKNLKNLHLLNIIGAESNVFEGLKIENLKIEVGRRDLPSFSLNSFPFDSFKTLNELRSLSIVGVKDRLGGFDFQSQRNIENLELYGIVDLHQILTESFSKIKKLSVPAKDLKKTSLLKLNDLEILQLSLLSEIEPLKILPNLRLNPALKTLILPERLIESDRKRILNDYQNDLEIIFM